MTRVLVVDDELSMRSALQASFSKRGWNVDTAACAREALVKFRRERHPLVVTDVRMPGDSGLAVMREIQAISRRTAVILLTAYANIPEAVDAIKNGACDYLVKPVPFEQIEHAALRVLERLSPANEHDLVGHAPVWLEALEYVRQAGSTTADILMQAESGTGKELVARYIHRISARAKGPFVAVNCAAFPEALLESELFGHARGAGVCKTWSKQGSSALISSDVP